ncbi:MAG: hypothetical protein JWM95_3096 [Gemmatimonadetes bacterium]|nr:hypothetical protein [Gemmatimonadota bacterium]
MTRIPCAIQQKQRFIQLTSIRPTMTPLRRRKNIFIDQDRMDRVRVLLQADTETETIDRALAIAEDYSAFEAEVMDGLASLRGRGGIVDHFPSGRASR